MTNRSFKNKLDGATVVASSRSSGGKTRSEKNTKEDPVRTKHGSVRENEFLDLIKKFTEKLNVDIMECDKVPEVVLDFKKKDKNKLN